MHSDVIVYFLGRLLCDKKYLLNILNVSTNVWWWGDACFTDSTISGNRLRTRHNNNIIAS